MVKRVKRATVVQTVFRGSYECRCVDELLPRKLGTHSIRVEQMSQNLRT